MLNKLQTHLKYSILILYGVVVIVMLSKWTGKQDVNSDTAYLPHPKQRLRAVMRKAALHNSTAHSGQDAIASLVDVTQALSALNTAVTLVGNTEVAGETGVSTRTLQNEMIAKQAQLMAQISEPPETNTRQQLLPLPKI